MARAKRTAAAAKLFQTELCRSFVVHVAATGRYIVVAIPCITPVLALEKCDGEGIMHAMQTRIRHGAFLWAALRKRFPLRLDISTCDSSSANLRYEAAMGRRNGAGQLRLRLACQAVWVGTLLGESANLASLPQGPRGYIDQQL